MEKKDVKAKICNQCVGRGVIDAQGRRCINCNGKGYVKFIVEKDDDNNV